MFILFRRFLHLQANWPALKMRALEREVNESDNVQMNQGTSFVS